jgi:hypothetical protein
MDQRSLPSPDNTDASARGPTTKPERGGHFTDAPVWVRAATVTLVADLVLHTVAATLANDWEGWGVFWNNVAFIVLTGLVWVALTFGLLVRWGLTPSPRGRNRAAPAAAVAGILSIVAYLVYFTWAPLVVAPAALVLARAGLRDATDNRTRGLALTGAVLGTLSLCYWAFCIAFVLITGSFPLPGPQ